MPQYQNDVRSALVAVVNSVWTDVRVNGIYRAQELARIPWETKASANQLPICVIDLEPTPTLDYGMANRSDTITATIYRIVKDSEDHPSLMLKLEALRTALWPDSNFNPLNEGQVMEYPTLSDSMNLAVNDYFLKTAKPYWAGAVIVQVQAGEAP